MSMREEFEAWLLEVHGLTSEWSEERNCFQDYPAHLAYKAWRASRAALVVELPEEQPGYMYYAPDVVDAIEAAGGRVKP